MSEIKKICLSAVYCGSRFRETSYDHDLHRKGEQKYTETKLKQHSNTDKITTLKEIKTNNMLQYF